MQLKFWFYTQLHMYTYTLLSKNMNASKRGHTPSSEENENKRSRAQDDSPERLDTIHTYNKTEVDDVYTTKKTCKTWTVQAVNAVKELV